MRLKILIFSLFPIMLLGQANLTSVRSYDSTFSIVNQNSPSDTLVKITKDGKIIKYTSNSPVDTFTTKTDVENIVSQISDSSLVSSTNSIDLVLDTLRAENETAFFKNLFGSIGSIFQADTIKGDEGFFQNLWGGVGSIFQADTGKFDVFSVGDSELIDTIIELKYAIENESFDSINIGQVIRFNESEGVHEFLTGDNQVVWQGALEDLVQVYNNTGSIVANGTPFYLAQALGDTIIAIGIASANIPQGKALAGLITGEIGINEWGFGCVRGKVRGINTSSLSLSGVTWLSNDSSYTSTAPAYPSEKIIIGGAISIHATEGIIYVQPSLGFQRQLKTKSYSFTSSGIASGTFWDAGFYDYDVGDATLDEVSSDLDYGTANIAYEAHPFVVYGGAGSVTGGGRVALITTGTSIDGTGTQTALDVDTLINDITNAVLNAYNETKKYLGTFYYELVVVEGTPSAYSLDFNYGYAKYDDIGDRDFYITGLECTWRGAQTDATGFDIELLFHRTTGWTYNAEAFVAGDGTIAKRSTDQAGFLGVLDGQQAAWKRTDLNTFISGSTNEGFIWKINTGANGTIQIMNMHIEIALD